MNIFRLFAKYLITICLILDLAACKKHTVTWEQMDIAESLMINQPDSALVIMEKLDKASLGSKEENARYALLKSMILDKNYVDTTNFDVLQPAIDYYLHNGNADEKLRTYYYQGRIYQNRGDMDSAMQSYMRGYEYMNQAVDTMTAANLLVAQGVIQYSTYSYNDFINNNLKAAELYKAISRHDYEILSIANALDGSIINGDSILADSIMDMAHNLVNQNSEFESVIMPYVLTYTLKFGKREEVMEILHYYESVDSIDDLEKLDIADAYRRMGDSRNSKRILESIGPSSKARESLKYLAVKSGVLELNGDLSGALNAYEEFQATVDSIHLNIFTHDLLFAKQRHEMEKANLKKIQRKDEIILVSLCAFFLLLAITCFVYYRYRLGRTRILLDKIEKDKLQYESENLRYKIKELEDESYMLKETLERQHDLAKPVADAIRIRIEMLNGLLARQITENDSYAQPYDDWKSIITRDKDEFMNSTRLAFKASHPKFIDYLEEHGLTDAEINYVCLYALGLRGKEVGEYIQLKRHYHISSDIRRKLGLDEHQTNLGIYIRRLMKEQ